MITLTWNAKKYTIYEGEIAESCHVIDIPDEHPRHFHIPTKQWWHWDETGAWLPIS